MAYEEGLEGRLRRPSAGPASGPRSVNIFADPRAKAIPAAMLEIIERLFLPRRADDPVEKLRAEHSAILGRKAEADSTPPSGESVIFPPDYRPDGEEFFAIFLQITRHPIGSKLRAALKLLLEHRTLRVVFDSGSLPEEGYVKNVGGKGAAFQPYATVTRQSANGDRTDIDVSLLKIIPYNVGR